MARRKEGAFIEIELENGKYSYGRILQHASYAFYDIYSDRKISDVSAIQKGNVIFIIAVYKYAITKNRWKIIGIEELETKYRLLPNKFMQDIIDPSLFSIYNPNTGEMIPATKEECFGLERSAVWEPEHVEDRLIDHFENRPNKWVESLKITNPRF